MSSSFSLTSKDVGAVVMDLGSYSFKAGFAGEDTPKVVMPTAVGVVSSSKPSMAGEGAMDIVDESSDGVRSINRKRTLVAEMSRLGHPQPNQEIISPLKEGLINDWDAVEHLWHHALHKRLCVDPKETPILLSESSFNTRDARERITEIMFEKYELPALFLSKDAVLSTFAFANEKKTSGTSLVVDCGHSSTRIVPVYEGYVQRDALRISPMGGDAICKDWLKHLEESNGMKVHPRYMVHKRQVDQNKFEVTIQQESESTDSFREFHVQRLIHDIMAIHGRISIQRLYPEEAEAIPKVTYEMPDGNNLAVGFDRFSFPERVINNEALSGLDIDQPISGLINLMHAAVSNSDKDIRRDLLNNIIITGGMSTIEGFVPRIKKELDDYSDFHQQPKSRVISGSKPERLIGPWLGGSVLGSLPSYEKIWMSKSEFEERGSSLVERKCP